ncbi:MAG: CpsB/CapC family capsule biosynthesis tyrosine phosphatase, partial [Thermonemataceae bacterium]|nr:CpsB/CapC family capsule biosynthesis tyrosine phosphatase [Thermonemataceae bacterium]
MTSLFAFLSPKKNIQTKAIVEVDIHSHLLAGIDDGVSNMEQALAIIKKFMAMGYKKIVTTPHIMQDFYRNTPSIIREKLKELKDYLNKN